MTALFFETFGRLGKEGIKLIGDLMATGSGQWAVQPVAVTWMEKPAGMFFHVLTVHVFFFCRGRGMCLQTPVTQVLPPRKQTDRALVIRCSVCSCYLSVEPRRLRLITREHTKILVADRHSER